MGAKGMISDKELLNNWQQVMHKIQQACQQANRANHEVTLLAVSKYKPVAMINTLFQQGQINFGENYLQEALDKINQLDEKGIIWHYIGHIQRNKTRDIAENFAWVHTVERSIIAKRLNEQRPEHLPALNVLIQVNIDDESSKSGCQIDELPALIEEIKGYQRLVLRGLMIIPAKQSTDAFKRTQDLFIKIANEHQDLSQWDTLSMGMSADINEAVQYGSTIVRVGTAIFGERVYGE